MKKYLLLFPLLLGCANRYAIRFDEGTTPEQQRIVHEQAEKWNRVTKNNRKFTFDQKRGGLLITFVKILILSDGKEWGGRECTRVGTDCPRAHWIRLAESLGERLPKGALHELGHALDMKHTTDRNGVMMPGTNQLEIQESDLAECRRVDSCE